MDHLIPVNIVIADRSYRIRIEKEEEELVRKTVKMVNEKIIEFKTNLAGKDMQDYVSMALIWFATEQNKQGAEMVKWKELAEKLSSFESAIDKAML